MEGDVEKRITYFRYCGEVNTEKVLQAAKLRCEDRNAIILRCLERFLLKILLRFCGEEYGYDFLRTFKM